MVVCLKNGDTHIIDSMNDIRDLVDSDLFEAIQDITADEIQQGIDEYEENNLCTEDATELRETNEKLKRELNDVRNERIKKQIQVNKFYNGICRLERLNNEYKKSKSKRIDKETLTIKLDEAIKELRSITGNK